MIDNWQLRDYDPVLTNFSTGFEDKRLVGLSVAPELPTSQLAGRYLVWDRSGWLVYPDLRAPGTVAHEIMGAKWSTTPYSVREHSLQTPIFDEERERMGSAGSFPVGFDLEEEAVGNLTRSLLIGHEQTTATLFTTSGNYPGGSTSALATADQWDNYGSATSDPVADVEAAMRVIYSLTGRSPNAMVIPWIVWSWLRNHPKIVDRFKSFQLTAEQAFQELTGFSGTLYIAESQRNTADNIDATESITDIWGKNVWIGIVDPQPSQKTKTFAKTFVYPYQGQSRPIDRWREEPRKADLFRESFRYDVVITSNVAGYLYQTVIA